MKKSSFENKVLEFMSDVTEFIKEQKEFNNSVVDFIKEQKEFNQKVDQRLSVLESFHKDDFRKNTNHKK
ncbi:hypothetical protein ACJA29_00350 [Metamycoplasma sualvi]|uniref:hypothetical protein n=1 Tax=Metamycoplasma sualvi TaxID=2125 RepID=UPI003873BD94